MARMTLVLKVVTALSPLPIRLARRSRRAFTLVEVCFAVTIFSLFAATSIYALSQANRFASNSRYRTLALAAAQQKIDQIMTTSWSVAGPVPPILTAGTTKEESPATPLPLNNDPYNSATGLGSTFTNDDVQVMDSRTTVITKLTDCSGNTGSASRLLRATVTVAYTYRGKPATVSLTTLRRTDDF